MAENATYVYDRGDSKVEGASIRLAEVVARHWGNFNCGVIEVERRSGESTVKAFAWDLESNYYDEKVFTVSHWRDTKAGGYALTKDRDIYEKVANDAARRKRACIMAVIPAYVFDEAIDACTATVKNSMAGEPIEETREKLFEAFQTLKEDITKEQLVGIVSDKKKFDQIDTNDIIKLRRLYLAIKEGFADLNHVLKLDVIPIIEDEELDALNEKFSKPADDKK